MSVDVDFSSSSLTSALSSPSTTASSSPPLSSTSTVFDDYTMPSSSSSSFTSSSTASSPPTNSNSNPIQMTLKYLKSICRTLDLYSTPELNDKLYLHYKGFTSFHSDLSLYSGLKVLYLEGNGLTELKEFPNTMSELKCLYLQENSIHSIDGLENCPSLHTINLSQNFISSLSPSTLHLLPNLHTLNVSKNQCHLYSSLLSLKDNNTICVLDVSSNDIEGDIRIVDEIICSMRMLSVLYLKGNNDKLLQEITTHKGNYRKYLISKIPTLKYLDEKPIFDEERRTAEAWAKGGAESEEKERGNIMREKREKEERQFMSFREMIKESRKINGKEEKEEIHEDQNEDNNDIDSDDEHPKDPDYINDMKKGDIFSPSSLPPPLDTMDIDVEKIRQNALRRKEMMEKERRAMTAGSEETTKDNEKERESKPMRNGGKLDFGPSSSLSTSSSSSSSSSIRKPLIQLLDEKETKESLANHDESDGKVKFVPSDIESLQQMLSECEKEEGEAEEERDGRETQDGEQEKEVPPSASDMFNELD